MNRVRWMQNAYQLTAEDVVLQKTRIHSTYPFGNSLGHLLGRVLLFK